MRALTVRHSQHQEPAEPWQIFELQRRSAVDYYLIPTNPSGHGMPPLRGFFDFVVLADDPGRVYCGLMGGLPSHIAFEVEGHTSISHGAAVLFAGQLEFTRGQLTRWTNGSGHYLPAPYMRKANLLPAVKLLLPKALFRPVVRTQERMS